MPTRTLTLNLNGEYFDAIKNGEKTEEYREWREYWRKRLTKNEYETVVICRGYPKKGDEQKRLYFKWNGFKIKVIIHPHFNNEVTIVAAIDLSQPIGEEIQ